MSSCTIPMSAEWPTFAVQFIYTIATILILIVAVLPEQVRSRLRPPKLDIQLSPHRGVLVQRGSGSRVWFFHISATNSRPASPARAARVSCFNIRRIDANGVQIQPPYETRIPLLWAHWDVLGVLRDIHHSELCDLCSVDEGSAELTLALWFTNSATFSRLRAHERLGFNLEIEHSGGVETQKWFVSIDWNGEWSDDRAKMLENLKIGLNPVLVPKLSEG
jgi:hypothetical protein